MRPVRINEVNIGKGFPIALIAGPCVIESESLVMQTADRIKNVAEKLGVPFVFKSSYDKANRTSLYSFRGLGIDKGLRVLKKVKDELGVPLLTDVHSVSQVRKVSEVVDILQIPAFLCRQTDLLLEVGKGGKPVNIKKGQFLAPEDMKFVAEKVSSTGNEQIMLTERGTCFGYHNLVVDMRSIVVMSSLGYPVIFDATHSLQLPGGGGKSSGGQPDFIIPLAKAAVAAGANALFVETHPEPHKALSDSESMLPLGKLEELLKAVRNVN